MTTWIGSIGSMVPTLCASDLPTASEDRWLTGGGAGTLAPRRHLMLTQHGPGARSWSFSRGACATDDAASLQSLARAQEVMAGAWRFVPCGAVHTNMLTPGASEELRGWVGTVSLAGMGRLVEPQASRESYGLTVTAQGTVSSPPVPLLGDGPWTVTDGIHVKAGAASVQVVIDALNAAGAVIASQTITTVPEGTPGTPTRVLGSWQITASAAAAHRLRCVSTATYTLARASLAQTSHHAPWRPGQAADAVVLRGVSINPIIDTPETALASVSYIAEETGV